MAPLKILICGGGIAGPALAFWLARSGHHVVIVERFPALRATGAQIDLREQGIQVVKAMGLLETIRSKLVDEAGMSLVDSQGKVLATIMANTSGKGAQSLTSEFELMRGDLVRMLYEQTKDSDNVEYVFGKTVESFEQDETCVRARFSDGSSDIYDMLVGADGQGSRVRKAILSSEEDPVRKMGIHMAYWFVPRTEDDDNIRRTYNAPGGRMVFRRTHSPTETQVYFILRDASPELSSVPRSSVAQQKMFWAQRFRDAGWQMDRFIAGMQTTSNWFCQEVVQIRTSTWHRGRVVLLGDAAHCPSPFSGMGTTGALIGAYVLAGEISRSPDDLARAFASYDAALRPFVDEIQNVKPFLLRLGIPETWWGIMILHAIYRVVCFLRIPDLISRFSSEEKGGWKLPDYSELKPAW
ncbi:FAD/NAD(P)-binding domain-containing protein [Hypoxylon rubiginosum]|uniref:FAD/NAD(P)-binding domain-containing protein n=1 Tax=Hypoxylon rubiginosum TaxID=110542 RepID=A0ACC0DAM2_9PEZI|nr:FAD/NAD(P)-binding domain-containing protein [Hypoxylon rubiginosum]